MLHSLYKGAASAGSPLYKACMGIFLARTRHSFIACTALRLRGHWALAL